MTTRFTAGPAMPRLWPAISATASVFSVALGVAALAGWAFDVALLRSMLPGLVAMNPATAIGFILTGGALGLWAGVEDSRPLTGTGRRAADIATLLAALVVLLGAAKLLALVGGPDLALDRLLFAERLDEGGGGFVNRMAPNTAICFLGSGCALMLLRLENGAAASQVISICVGLFALLAAVGYGYQLATLYSVSTYIPMALNTAAGFLTVALGAVLARPDRGIAAVVTGRGMGGVLARRLLPAAILVPLAMGWGRITGQRAGLYGSEFGVALMVVGSIIVFVLLILAAARLLERTSSERLAAEERYQETSLFFESIFENLPLMVFVKEAAELRFVKMNRAGEELLGLERSALIGRNDADFFPPEQAEFSAGMDRQVLLEGTPVDIPEESVETAGGGTRALHTRKVPLLGGDGEPRYLLGISEDITERKRAEARVRQLNAELEAFSYSVSHDLRAPLRAIAGFSQALAEDHADHFDGDGRRMLERIQAATLRMSDLIDGMLALSRISRAEIIREEVDLSRLAHDVVDDLRRSDPGRDVQVEIEDGLVARGDPRLLRVVVQNLIGNAWKYTRDSLEPRIEFLATDEDNSRFVVRDNGAGFDMAYADKLFGAFQRLHGVTEFEGTGIGLATVQRILHRHGGHIRGEGVVGEGAAFLFTV